MAGNAFAHSHVQRRLSTEMLALDIWCSECIVHKALLLGAGGGIGMATEGFCHAREKSGTLDGFCVHMCDGQNGTWYRRHRERLKQQQHIHSSVVAHICEHWMCSIVLAMYSGCGTNSERSITCIAGCCSAAFAHLCIPPQRSIKRVTVLTPPPPPPLDYFSFL